MTPISAAEYKSIVGLEDLYYALITADDDTAYTPGTPKKLAPAVEANAKTATSTESQYADDKPFEINTTEGPTEIEITTTAIPLATLGEVLGKPYDDTNGLLLDIGSEATPPDVALGYKAMKSNGKFRYYWYYKGKFTVPDEEAKTMEDKKEHKPAKITYTAINTIKKFTTSNGTHSMKRIVGDDDATGFVATDWFTTVKTPPAVAP